MRNLLYKELKLCLHPMLFIYMAFILMLFIPNYPYLVPCFFVCNGIFFTFMQSLQNKDIDFTLLLPIGKRDAVKAKYLFVMLIQLAVVLLYAVFVPLNHLIMKLPNVMLDACPALLGFVFVTFGIFNSIFMPSFYKTCTKPGRGFLIASIAVFAWIFILEGVFIASGNEVLQSKAGLFNWIHTNIDCWPATSGQWVIQLVVIAAGAAIYALMTRLSFRRSVRNFERVDL